MDDVGFLECACLFDSVTVRCEVCNVLLLSVAASPVVSIVVCIEICGRFERWSDEEVWEVGELGCRRYRSHGWCVYSVKSKQTIEVE